MQIGFVVTSLYQLFHFKKIHEHVPTEVFETDCHACSLIDNNYQNVPLLICMLD